jgi:hypothetical protein
LGELLPVGSVQLGQVDDRHVHDVVHSDQPNPVP